MNATGGAGPAPRPGLGWPRVWDQNGQAVEPFTDVRELQRELKAKGLEVVAEADEGSAGPSSFVVLDPDGNPVLVDQHV